MSITAPVPLCAEVGEWGVPELCISVMLAVFAAESGCFIKSVKYHGRAFAAKKCAHIISIIGLFWERNRHR